MEERRFLRLFLAVPSLLVLYFVFRIFQPFLVALCLAAILATLCYPPYKWLRSKLGGKNTWAALLSCLAITALIIVPFVTLTILLAQQASELYQRLRKIVEQEDFYRLEDLAEHAVFGPAVEKLQSWIPIQDMDLAGVLLSTSEQVSLFFLRYSTVFISEVASVVTGFAVMVVALFFLFRDGERLVQQFRLWTPLSEKYEGIIIHKFKEVSSATILGSLATSATQFRSMLWRFLSALFI